MVVDSVSPVFHVRLRPIGADQSMSWRPLVRYRTTAANQPMPGLKLRRSFDRAATNFDSVAALPREIAARMIERLLLVQLPARRILDAGCGTGSAAALLRQRFTGALVIELDASEQMLRQRATRPKPGWFRIGRRSTRLAVCADFQQLPLAAGSIDLIWSNLALHWAEDLPQALAEANRVLRPGGLLMFSVFGPDTLQELRLASPGGEFRVNQHLDMHDIGDMLVHCGYADPVMDMEKMTLTYVDVGGLLRDLRAHGSTAVAGSEKQGLRGRADYLRVVSRYEQFRGDARLPATFEVIYGHAWKQEPRLSPKGKPVIDIVSARH
jgi:malonyl-CoA O-methyltransferase